MISKLGLSISRVVERVVPDPFVIAIFLTIITAIAALLWGNFGDQSSIVGLKFINPVLALKSPTRRILLHRGLYSDTVFSQIQLV